MGHGSGPAVVVDQPGCRVLPVIEEEEPEPYGEGSPEMVKLAERKKAIVARMRELLSRAAAAQSAHSKLRRSTVATAKKWKLLTNRVHATRAVGRIQRRGKNHEQAAGLQQEDGMLSSSSSISSQSSFSWDAAATAAESCCSASGRSPLLWPAFVSTGQAETTADQRQMSSPATSVLRLSCTSSSSSWSEDDDMRMAHWVTTDSDCNYLSSCHVHKIGNSLDLQRNKRRKG